MPDNGKPKAHRYADLFPMMTALELEALAADVAEHGLRQPVVLYQGQVLDGRNRLLACEKTGIEPAFTEHEGDDASALALVISLNVQRRDLTAAQRAIAAAMALEPFKLAAEKRRKLGTSVPDKDKGRATKQVAKVFKVGWNAVEQASVLLVEAPDLTEQVRSCTLSLAAAYEQLLARRKQAKQKQKDAERVAEYKDAISSGEMDLEEALQQAIEEERRQREDLAAEADARRTWLKEFAEHLSWFERFLADRTDEHLLWYTLANSPGLFHHGLTTDRIDAVVKNLRRACRLTFGGQQHVDGSSVESREPAA